MPFVHTQSLKNLILPGASAGTKDLKLKEREGEEDPPPIPKFTALESFTEIGKFWGCYCISKRT